MPRINSSLDQLFMSTLQTNFGWMRPVSNGKSLIRLDWNQSGWKESERPDHVSRETKLQLQAFFSGQLNRCALPLAPEGKNDTGRYWLEVMAQIPYGTVMTYAKFASLAGKPKGARAAGSSCATNPIPIIYPCHRVIRTDGTLGNYGGGSNCHPASADNIARKAALIHFESCHLALII